MTTLKFADTHNMAMFFAKPAESEGFEQIVDFLNAHTIKYTLTINPTIYTLCFEQLWATVKAKNVNGEVQLQALVDGKKIIITESIVRRDLQLEDVEGIDCLPNATIFEQLTLMGLLHGMSLVEHTTHKDTKNWPIPKRNFVKSLMSGRSKEVEMTNDGKGKWARWKMRLGTSRFQERPDQDGNEAETSHTQKDSEQSAAEGTDEVSGSHLQDRILDHMSSLKSLINQHNERSGTLIKPIRLTFGDEGKDDKGKDDDEKAEEGEEDLQKPHKEVLRSPFTRRIIEFSALKHRMPANLRIFDGSTDPDDHISHFVGAANVPADAKRSSKGLVSSTTERLH
ncbi:hypothetical protein Tco_0184870 [Tanacetum coccineum]